MTGVFDRNRQIGGSAWGLFALARGTAKALNRSQVTSALPWREIDLAANHAYISSNG